MCYANVVGKNRQQINRVKFEVIPGAGVGGWTDETAAAGPRGTGRRSHPVDVTGYCS